MAEMKAGTYKVIGDILTLKQGAGEKATYGQHRRGAVVKLTAEQANRFGTGTRPMVVPTKEAAPAQTTTPDEDNKTPEETGDDKDTKGGKSTAKASS